MHNLSDLVLENLGEQVCYTFICSLDSNKSLIDAAFGYYKLLLIDLYLFYQARKYGRIQLSDTTTSSPNVLVFQVYPLD